MGSKPGIGGHTKPHRGNTDDWLTPPDIVQDLGPFDLDPCASVGAPWLCATNNFYEYGLESEWHGFVWLNPPYGPQTWKWLNQLSDHPDGGIALTFARTETNGFHMEVWDKADALFFFRGRLFFHYPKTGERAPSNAGGPSVLVGYGSEAKSRLRHYAKTRDGIFLPRTW